MAEITEMSKGSKTESEKGDTSSETPSSVKFANASKVQIEADKLRAKRELPKPPGDVIKFSELKDWLGLLTGEMCDRLMIYIYRHKPVINRQFVDPNADNNIDVVSGEGCKNLNEDYFIDRHGGGSYGLTIKDTDTVDKRKNNRGYFEARLYINETQYPPKLDYREVDWTNDKNKGYFAWARAQRIVDNNGAIMDVAKKETNGNGNNSGGNNSNISTDTVGVLKVVMDTVSKLTEQQQRDFKKQIGGDDAINKPMTELLIAKMKEDSPNQIMPLLTTILPLMMKQPVQTGDGGLGAMATMMTTMMTAMMTSSRETMVMMQENNKNTMTILTTMMNNAGKGDDDGDRLKQVVEIAKMIKGSAAPETTVTEKIVDKGMELLMPIANIIANITGIKAGQANMGNPNPAGHPIPGMNGPNSQQQIPANASTQLGNNRANMNPVAQPSPVSAENPNETAVVQTIQQYGPLILQALNAGKAGWEFAEDVSRLFGDMVIQAVSRHGTDNLISGMKKVPEFWGVIDASYGEAHMRKWCDEFINYKKISAEVDAEGDLDYEEGEPEVGVEGSPEGVIETK